jgi:hypothetical protein
MNQPVFIVLCATDYEGDNVESVHFKAEEANAARDKLQAKRWPQQSFRVEKWLDGGTEGTEIE